MKSTYNFPTYYYILCTHNFSLILKTITINITTINNHDNTINEENGVKIYCKFTQGNKYKALVFNRRQYNEEINKIKQMIFAENQKRN